MCVFAHVLLHIYVYSYVCWIHTIISILQDEGVQFQLGKEKYTFRGTLALVVGDNLGSQYIGGYKQLASALRKCRYCMAVAEDMSQR